MFIAIAVGALLSMWLGKDIMKRWFDQKEKNLEVSLLGDDLKQAKKVKEINKKVDEFIEEEGSVTTVKEVRKKLKV